MKKKRRRSRWWWQCYQSKLDGHNIQKSNDAHFTKSSFNKDSQLAARIKVVPKDSIVITIEYYITKELLYNPCLYQKYRRWKSNPFFRAWRKQGSGYALNVALSTTIFIVLWNIALKRFLPSPTKDVLQFSLGLYHKVTQ